MIHWHVLDFHQLSIDQLYQIMKLRQDIFVVEQTCPYPDMDGLDPQCKHLFAIENDQVIATTRLLPKGLAHPDYAAIGRVVIAEQARGRQLGYELMQRSIDAIRDEHPKVTIKIGAQQHLEGFYNKLGFNTISEMYLEDDIPHIDMLLSD
jgi:ElaA protein